MGLRKLLVLLLFLFSCTTLEEQEAYVKSLNQVYTDGVESLLEEGRFLEALQDIEYLDQWDKVEDKTVLAALRARALAALEEEYTNALTREDWARGLQIFISLSKGGYPSLPGGLDEVSLYFKYIQKTVDQGGLLPALILALEGDYSYSEEQLTYFLDLAYELQNREGVRQFSLRMEAMGLDVDSRYKAILTRKPTHKEMLEGIAIVWVDKGIRVEGGVGYPNRVLGSGFFIDKRGYLLTNYHVIASEVDPEYEGYSRLYIRMTRNVNERIPAKVIGYDPVLDLALLKVEIEPKFVFSSGVNQSVEPGDKVLAMGSPVDPVLGNTITSGIISALGRRQFLQMGDILQVDAPINPGNSGGPLISEEGVPVGIVFAGLEMFEGLNFAITYNWVNKLLPSLYEGGEASHSWMGMAIDENEFGLEVLYTVPGEPAARLGLRMGDFLLGLNGKPVKSVRDFQEQLLGYRPGTMITLDWKRESHTYASVITLGERPFQPMDLALSRDLRQRIYLPLFGMSIEKVKNVLWETTYKVTHVVQGSPADNIGLSLDDPINIQQWYLDEENRIAVLQIYVKKKKAGYFETIVQIASYLESDNWL